MFLMLIAMSSDHHQTRWPRHPGADQGRPERVCRGRGCVGRTDGASHLHVWLGAPCPLLMATWRTAGRIRPAGQRGAQPSDFVNWWERPVRLCSQKQHYRRHVGAGDSLGYRRWVMVDADLSLTDNDDCWFWTPSLYLSSRQERDRKYPGRLIWWECGQSHSVTFTHSLFFSFQFFLSVLLVYHPFFRIFCSVFSFPRLVCLSSRLIIFINSSPLTPFSLFQKRV